VPKEKTNMGTGIINLARNIGASVGIATVTTQLDRRSQFHQARLMEHVNDYSAAYRNMLNGTQARLISAGSTAAHASAQSARNDLRHDPTAGGDAGISRQFQDARMVFFAVIPILVLMKKPKRRAGSVPVH